jgi:ClpP class serine protease
VDEFTVTTGPFKRSGQPRDRAIGEIATIQHQFLQTVAMHRGEKLKISVDELSQAGVYSGTESLRYGLVDEIGTKALAARKAAELAHLRNYGISECLIQCTEEVELEELKVRTNNIPTYYYLYFELE